MNDRARGRAWLALVPLAAVLLAVAFVIANGGATLPPTAVTSAGPSASATGAGHATAQPATLSARHAVVSGSLTFTRESDGASVGKVNAPAALFAVSPDGARIAYFTGPGFDELWAADVAHLDRAQRVLSIAPYYAGALVWSTDGQGVLFTGYTRERAPGPLSEPAGALLEGVHLGTGEREEFARKTNSYVRPLVWVRERREIAAATGYGQRGTPSEYIWITAGASATVAIPDADRNDVMVLYPQASSDGRWMATRYEYSARTVIRLWPTADLRQAIELEAQGKQIRAMLWRPGSSELTVDVDGTLELWTREGTKRRVTDLGGRSILLFRWDGSAVYAGTMGGPTEVIEIDTGRRAPLPEIPVMGAAPSSIVASARLE